MRITSSATRATVSPLPTAQAAPAGGSFKAVLADASSDPRADSAPVGVSAKDGRPEKIEERPADAKVMAAAEEATSKDQGAEAVEGTAAKDSLATASSAGANASTVVAASTVAAGGTATVGVTLGQVVATSGDAYTRKGIVAVPVSEGSSEGVGSLGANVAVAEISAVRAPVKQDRTKAPAEDKASSTVATAEVAVVVPDQTSFQAVNPVSWQGMAHGQPDKDVVSGTTTNAICETAAKALSKAPAFVEAAADAKPIVAVSPDSVAAPQPGPTIPTPVESAVAAFESLLLPSVLAPAAVGNAEGVPAMGKPMGKGAIAADSSAAANGTAGVSASAGGGSLKGSSVGAEGLLHASTTVSQPTQGTEPEPSKPSAGANVRAIDNAGMQGMVQTVVHEGGSPPSSTAATASAGHTAKAENLPTVVHAGPADVVGSSGINSAKIIQSLGESEMHVGMHSEEFGDISIRTSLSQQQMVTQISLSHSDLSQAISTHLSNVQAKLGEEYGLHASIEINNQGAPLSGGQGNAQQRDQQTYARSTTGNLGGPTELNESVASFVALSTAGSGHGLDIRV